MRKLLFLFLCFALMQSAQAQMRIPNSGFELSDASSSSGAVGWSCERSGIVCRLDTVHHQGLSSLYLRGAGESGSCLVYNDLPLRSPKLRRYLMHCWLRADGLKGLVALSARCYSKSGQQLCGGTLAEINSSSAWRSMDGEFYLDTACFRLSLCIEMNGVGDVWIDDVEVKELSLPNTACPPVTQKYLDEFFTIVSKNWIGRDTVKVSQLRDQALVLCGGHSDKATINTVLKRYICYCLDEHCSFTSSSELGSSSAASKSPTSRTESGTSAFVKPELFADSILMLRISTLPLVSDAEMQRVVDSTHRLFKLFDRPSIRGWIIDLRACQGNNLNLLMAELSPLMAKGIVFKSAINDSTKLEYTCTDASCGWSNENAFRMKSSAYHLLDSTRALAVLQSSSTQQAALAGIVALKTRASARCFGQRTKSPAMRSSAFKLSDGSLVSLSCGMIQNLQAQNYSAALVPDVATTSTEESVLSARTWIAGQRK